MQKISPVAALLILLSSAVSITIGVLLDRRSPANSANYRAVYYGARCVLRRADPYRTDEFRRIYEEESGVFPTDPFAKQLFLRAVPVCVNLPTTLVLVAPLAKLSWGASRLVWLVLIALLFTLAGFLAYDLGREYAPRLSLILVCLMLANSEVLFTVGNTAGIAVSLCVVALWTFVRQRASSIGVICLATSLLLKPHDSGLIWACLLFLGGSMRKRAVLSLIVCLAVAVPSLVWISRIAPDWNHELKTNLASTAQRGDISDPGPSSISRRSSADVIISLQTVLSLFLDDPAFYNPTSILICASLFAILLLTTVRYKVEFPDAWYALAAVAALTMLPSYHRPYDARLLLLAVPASAMLWAQKSRINRALSMITVAAVLLTGDIPLAIVSVITRNIDVSGLSLSSRIFEMPILRPSPLILLFLAVLYSVIYVRHAHAESRLHLAGADNAMVSSWTSTPK